LAVAMKEKPRLAGISVASSGTDSRFSDSSEINASCTSEAQRGAIQRMSEPSTYDVVFPVVAFLLVIVAPAVTALWVIFRTATDKTKEADET
jgi:hypothetical protein